MKKVYSFHFYALLTFGFLFSNYTESQQLTKRQVFDYDLGDVIQSQYNTVQNFNSFYGVKSIADSIVGKWTSPNNDTITYIKLRRQRNITQDDDLLFLVYDTITGNLDEPIPFTPPWGCLPYDSTFTTNSCGIKLKRIASVYVDSCFEPKEWVYTIYEGLGSYYSYGNFESAYAWVLRSSFTKKFGQCGNPIFPVVDFKAVHSKPELEEEENDIELLVYPNPVKESLTIENHETLIYILTNSTGQIILNGTLEKEQNKLDLTGVNPGVYLLQLREGDDFKILKISVL